MKKIVLLVVCFLTFINVMGQNVQDTIVSSYGTIYWKLDALDSTLTFWGTGEIQYDDTDPSFWDLRDAFHTLIIGDGITAIGFNTFIGCENLRKIYLGKDINSIMQWFFWCDKVEEITVKATTPPSTFPGDEGHDDLIDRSIPLYVPKGEVDSYKNSMFVWHEFTNIIGKNFTAVDEVNAPALNITTEGLTIVIHGIDHPEIMVSTISGKVIAQGNLTKIPVPQAGIYIVKVNGMTQKVLVEK